MERQRQTVAKTVETFTHDEASRKNIPTAEHQPVMAAEDRDPIQVAYERRNRDLDPQLVWRGKDTQDWSDLAVQAPPLFIQEKVHPKALVDDLLRHAKADEKAAANQPDLFADFNGLPSADARTEFYQHDANWSNRMILGDSLQVMASLAEREGLRGKVQCIYVDPPYGIKFNSNFQWSTTSRDVKDGKAEHITREPEQVKAFRDTWRDGIHSYLTYLRDRLTVARDLLAESGSIFVQIGDENVHRVRAVMDEVFGEDNCIVILKFAKTTGLGGKYVDDTFDYLLWFAKDENRLKFRRLFRKRIQGEAGSLQYNFSMSSKGDVKRIHNIDNLPRGERCFGHFNLKSQTGSESTIFEFEIDGYRINAPRKGGWKTNATGMNRLKKAGRILRFGNTPEYIRYFNDAPYFRLDATWLDTRISGFGDEKLYVVQTLRKVVERCILMTTDPGDLVLDPTCGSGTAAYVAEQWGRRWITIDTSRVALALARARVMGARYPYYLLADSPEGQAKEAGISRSELSQNPTHGNIRQGFVYERVPHVTLKSNLPRARGGTGRLPGRGCRFVESSPRARGYTHSAQRLGLETVIFPARAGVHRAETGPAPQSAPFPARAGINPPSSDTAVEGTQLPRPSGIQANQGSLAGFPRNREPPNRARPPASEPFNQTTAKPKPHGRQSYPRQTAPGKTIGARQAKKGGAPPKPKAALPPFSARTNQDILKPVETRRAKLTDHFETRAATDAKREPAAPPSETNRRNSTAIDRPPSGAETRPSLEAKRLACDTPPLPRPSAPDQEPPQAPKAAASPPRRGHGPAHCERTQKSPRKKPPSNSAPASPPTPPAPNSPRPGAPRSPPCKKETQPACRHGRDSSPAPPSTRERPPASRSLSTKRPPPPPIRPPPGPPRHPSPSDNPPKTAKNLRPC